MEAYYFLSSYDASFFGWVGGDCLLLCGKLKFVKVMKCYIIQVAFGNYFISLMMCANILFYFISEKFAPMLFYLFVRFLYCIFFLLDLSLRVSSRQLDFLPQKKITACLKFLCKTEITGVIIG